MASNISVAITANSADLQAKLALAQAALRGTTTEVNAAARAIVGMGDAVNDNALASFESLVQQQTEARAAVAAFRTELGETVAGRGGLVALRAEVEGMAAPMRNATAAFAAFGEAFGLAFAADRVLGGLDRLAEAGEDLQKLSETTGIAVETLSGWHYAADQVGVSAEDLDTGLMRLGRNIQAALVDPTGQAAHAFALAGFSADDLRAHSNDLQYVLLKMADAFRAHSEGAQADALAMELVGRQGAELVPFLREGSDGIEAMVQKNRELGNEMTGQMATAMKNYRDQVKDLSAAWHGLGLALANDVYPILTKLASFLTTITPALEEFTSLVVKISPVGQALAGANLVEAAAARSTGGSSVEVAIPPIASGASGSSAAGAAGAPGAAGPFGDLGQPVAELERFRTELDKVRAAMEAAGATNEAVLAREAQLWGQEVNDAQLTAQEKLQAEQGYSQARLALLKEESAAAKAAADEETRTASEAYRQQMALVKSDDEEALAAIRAAHAGSRLDQLQAEASYWRQIVAMTRQGTQQQIDAIKQLDQVTLQVAQEQASQWKEAEQQLESAFTRPVTRAFDTMVQGLVAQTRTWQQTMAKAFDQMAQSFIEDVGKMIAEWLAFEALQAVGGGGIASAFGMTGGPLATIFGAGGLIGGAEAGGGIFSGIASLFSSPLAGLAAFDVGTMGVPQTMLAMVHQGEIILPPGLSDAVRGGTATVGTPGSAAGGGVNNFNVNATLAASAIDARSIVQQIVNNPTVMRSFAAALGRYLPLNPSLSL
jgi:hypothetical protein